MHSLLHSSLARRSRTGVAALLALAFVSAAFVAVDAPAADAAVPAVTSVHPRLEATASDFVRLQKQIKAGDPATLKVYAAVKSEADADLKAPVVKYVKPDGIRLLATSETVVKHVNALGMMYRLTGNVAYKNRLWADLNAAMHFPDWNPNHFLDTAEMTNAFAIGYDWLYANWSPAQRSALVQAIVTKGLTPSLGVYRAAPTSAGPYKYGGNWSQFSNNWNVVVNSGLAIGALAVMNESPTVAKTVLGYALKSLGKGTSAYANGGGWAEGLTYWEYATRYLTLLTASLKTATGSDQGILERPGIAQTGYFPLYAADTDTSFNFADSAAGNYRSSALEALGKQLGDPVLSAAGAAPNGFGSNVQRLFSLTPVPATKQLAKAGLPLDKTFAGAGVTTFHSSWSDTNETFAGFRSSNTPAVGHQNLDAGTFSLGALGTTWAEELGKDDYGLAGYFESGAAGGRWNYYRERAEGQNTLIIDPTNPSSGFTTNQTTPAVLHANDSSAYAVANLTPVYKGQVTSWLRGVKTFDGKSQVIVQDEVTSTKSFDALWTMHTQAAIRISADGRTAMLYRDGKALAARITSPGAATFVDAPSTPYPTSPNPGKQTANPTMRSLEIDLHGSGSGRTTLAVQFTPVTDVSAALPAAAPLTSLSRWSLDSTSAASTAATPLPVSSASSDYTSGKYGTPALSIDGDTGTYFGIYGGTDGLGRTVTYTLAHGTTVRSALMSFMNNSGHHSDWIVDTSGDGSTWTRQAAGAFLGTPGDQTIRLQNPAPTKYVRFTLFGDKAGTDHFAAIAEARFYATDVSVAAPPARGAVVASAAVASLPTTMPIGAAAALKATARNTAGAAVSVAGATYVTSNPAVATVDARGVVHAVGAGSARVGVIVTADRVRAMAGTPVTVYDPKKVVAVADADTYIQAGNAAKSNFGALHYLLVKPTKKGMAASDYSRYAYVHFSAPKVVGHPVASAVITFRAKLSDAKGTSVRVDGHLGTGSWNEKKLTYVARTSTGSRIGTMVIGKTAGTVSMDVTSFVNSKAFTGSFTVVLTEDAPPSGSPLLVTITSRETKTPPTLSVRLR